MSAHIYVYMYTIYTCRLYIVHIVCMCVCVCVQHVSVVEHMWPSEGSFSKVSSFPPWWVLKMEFGSSGLLSNCF